MLQLGRLGKLGNPLLDSSRSLFRRVKQAYVNILALQSEPSDPPLALVMPIGIFVFMVFVPGAGSSVFSLRHVICPPQVSWLIISVGVYSVEGMTLRSRS